MDVGHSPHAKAFMCVDVSSIRAPERLVVGFMIRMGLHSVSIFCIFVL